MTKLITTNGTEKILAHNANKIKIQQSQQQIIKQQKLLQKEHTKKIWRNADAVCFDVDSTVCCDEAIDELAKFVGKFQEVSEITKSAMSGNINFKTALAQRLAIIRPSEQILNKFLSSHKPRLTPQIKELVDLLHKRGTDVYLVSGGFEIILRNTADELIIPYANIFANKIILDQNGLYAGFDESSPTSLQNGKSIVISMLKQTKGYKNVVMIGDGVTDLEACPPADAFIGFGGNQVREHVKNNAGWFVTSFAELINELLMTYY